MGEVDGLAVGVFVRHMSSIELRVKQLVPKQLNSKQYSMLTSNVSNENF